MPNLDVIFIVTVNNAIKHYTVTDQGGHTKLAL